MHILLIVDCYLPSTKSVAQLADDLARGFVGQGHDVTVLAPADDLKDNVTVSDEPGLHVVRYRAGRMKGANLTLRAMNEVVISLVAALRTRGYMAHRRYDYIVFYSPSIFYGPLVAYFRRRWKARSYLILRDIFPDWAIHTGVLRKGPAYYLFKVFERIQYRAADVIGVETGRSYEYFKMTPFIGKVELLRNWATTDRPGRVDRRTVSRPRGIGHPRH